MASCGGGKKDARGILARKLQTLRESQETDGQAEEKMNHGQKTSATKQDCLAFLKDKADAGQAEW